MNQKIKAYIEGLDLSTITDERKKILKPLVEYLQEKVENQEDIRLNYICTHNSRRSHLGQVWGQTMANFFGIKNVATYSGGTEATAMYPQVAETLKTIGFEVLTLTKGTNPVYAIKNDVNTNPIIGFSKEFGHKFNPQSKFSAVMVCSSADQNCPFVTGAEKRISITYDDPKAFDNTPQKAEKYLERSQQIATEMKFVFKSIR